MTYDKLISFRDNEKTGIAKGYEIEFLRDFYSKEELEKLFKSYTLEGMQSLINELQNQNEIDAEMKKKVFNIFFKKCAAKLKKLYQLILF